MGSSPKTLDRLKALTTSGDLPPGASICDIGATQLFGDEKQDAIRSFLSFYAERSDKAKRPENVPQEQLAAIAANGFLGDLLILAGFEYKALDIFHATNTILFDLNIHEPGPELFQRFDLVMNFGTTEHVFNQLRAFQTIHTLTKVNGVCYHDLPMAGYFNHALYRYDPLFFTTVVPVNAYENILEVITAGISSPVPTRLRQMGYPDSESRNVGIEWIYRRTNGNEFRVPLETSTALSVDSGFETVPDSPYVRTPANASVHYGTSVSLDSIRFDQLTKAWLLRLQRGVLRRLGLYH
jgi:hypothetical protein